MERINSEAEADALIEDFGEAAYDEARRRQDEASSDLIAKDWGLVALAVARLIGNRPDVDPLVRLAMNAVLVPNRADAASPRRRFYWARAALAPIPSRCSAGRSIGSRDRRHHEPIPNPVVGRADSGRTTLTEVEIEVADVSEAIVVAANIARPPRTIGLRIFDQAGREVFARQKADPRRGFAPPRGRQWAIASAAPLKERYWMTAMSARS